MKFIKLSAHMQTPFVTIKVLSKYVSTAADFEIILPRALSQFRPQIGASESSLITSFLSPVTQKFSHRVIFCPSNCTFLY